jgi:hypothetical protein
VKKPGRVDTLRDSGHRGRSFRVGLETSLEGSPDGRAHRGRLAATRSGHTPLNRTPLLEIKARTLAGWKAYATNIDCPTADFVIGSYHQLWRIEKSFRALPDSECVEGFLQAAGVDE